MSFEVTSLGEVNKVVLSGRLDSANVDMIELQFVARVVPPALSVIVDLSQVSFLASLGIRLLLSTARSLAGRGAKMALYAPTEAVADVIETTALDDIIPVVATEAEALAAIAA